MTVKEIRETRGADGNYRLDFDNKYLNNVTIKFAKARLESKGEESRFARASSNIVGDLFMGACIHCLISSLESRLPSHVEIKELKGTAKDTENPGEEVLEFNVEVSVSKEYITELDKVVKHLNDNGCSMMDLLKSTGMFKVIYNVKRV
jgi:hypothetical protein